MRAAALVPEARQLIADGILTAPRFLEARTENNLQALVAELRGPPHHRPRPSALAPPSS